jgi:hypothetical protein
VAQEQEYIALWLDSVSDGLPVAPGFDYEEIQSVAYRLCPTLETSSRGRRGGDLPSDSLDFGIPYFGGVPRARFDPTRLGCPAGVRWARNSGAVLNQMGPLGELCRTPGCHEPDPILRQTAASLVANPNVFRVQLPAFVDRERPLPPLPPGHPEVCAVDNPAAGYRYTPPPEPVCVPDETHLCGCVPDPTHECFPISSH